MKNFWALQLILVTSLSTQAGAGNEVYLQRTTLHAEDQVRLPLPSENSPQAWIVQFETKVTLSSPKVISYLPDDAFLIYGSIQDVKKEVQGLGMRWITPLQPQWKLSPMVDQISEATSDQEWIVTAAQISAVQPTLEQFWLLGFSAETLGDDQIHVTAKKSQLLAIAKIPSVIWVQPLPHLQTLDLNLGSDSSGNFQDPTPRPLTGFESGTKLMNFEAAWDRGLNGKGNYIGVYDTGIDVGQTGSLTRDLIDQTYWGYLFGYGSSSSWEDRVGHGTHVAGSIAGDGHQSEGILRGGAWGAKIHAAKIVSRNGLMVFKPDFNWLYGTLYADGIRLFNNSWGMADFVAEYDDYASRIDTFIAKNPDAVIIFAAGNGGTDADHNGRIDDGSIGPPATAKNVISVGASKNLVLEGGWQLPLSKLRDDLAKRWSTEPLASDLMSNNAKGIAPFSARGPTKDGRIKPDVVAPGTNILSVRSQYPGVTSTLWGAYSKDYLYSGGTSMSAPLVTAAAAVVRQYLRDERQFEKPSAAVIKGVLIHTATDLYPGQYGTGGPTQEILKKRPNNTEGYGLVNMDAATNLKNALIVDEQKGVATGQSLEWTIARDHAGPIRATLVYTDAPANPLAAHVLVNDLDLEMVLPDGTITTLQDHTNNVEMLELPNAPSGKITLRVKGFNVPQGIESKQSFALIASY